MDADLDLARLRHVAELAELSLTPEEEGRLAGEIGRIVSYVAELAAIDTTNVEPTAHLSGVEPTRSEDGWREDVSLSGLSHDDALAAAPDASGGGFAVPGFVD